MIPIIDIVKLVISVGLPAARDILATIKDTREATPAQWLELLGKIKSDDEYINQAKLGQ